MEENTFSEKLNKYKIPLVLCLVGGVLVVGGTFSSNLISRPTTNSANPTDYNKKSVVTDQTLSTGIKVDISGAVVSPGVYSLGSDARVEDLIKLAKGFSASASAEYIAKSLNLSAKLSDGQKVYIPLHGEAFQAQAVTGGGQVAGATTTNIGGKIGINTATESKLEELPGVGPATASKIIQGRPYSTIDELRTKKAVGKALLEKIRDLVDLN